MHLYCTSSPYAPMWREDPSVHISIMHTYNM